MTVDSFCTSYPSLKYISNGIIILIGYAIIAHGGIKDQ